MEETKTELQLIKMSEIQSQEISWLWYPFIPYGKLTEPLNVIYQSAEFNVQINFMGEKEKQMPKKQRF